MKNKYKYKPGDVLHLKKDICGDKPKGANYVVIGYDFTNYVALRLGAEDIFPYSLITNVFEGNNIVTKLGKVDLKQIPANLEEAVEFAREDDPMKWANPPELGYLKDCDVLKQYVI
ncbi:MAG: hypothetical protein V1734_05555 [Nanoarchaeota archaeon]